MSSSVSARHSKVLDLCYIALLAALMAICSWITISIGPVPFTMQTFAIFTALGLLGGRRGTLAVVVYLLLGAVGLPVFSGFSGGIASLLGPTGGFLIGFFFSALVMWGITARFGRSVPALAIAMVLALAVCYAFGTVWFMLVYTGGATLGTALGWCVIPFILPDLAKIVVALIVVGRVGKYVK